MKKGTRRADVKSRLTPRRLSRLDWFLARAYYYTKIAVAVAVLVGAVFWGWAQGYLIRAVDYSQGKIAVAAASVGMRVEDVIVEGRNHIDTDTLKSAIAVDVGAPMLAVDIEEIHARLTGIAWVKDVQVRRAFPDKLLVTLTERLPIAIWADAVGGPAVIDAEGVVLTHEHIADYGMLLAVEGKGCEKGAGALIALLKGQPDIAVRVKKAVRVSGRRWDLIMDGGMKLRLPEEDPGYALARAARAQLQEKVFDQKLKAIDLRQADRIILEGASNQTRDLLLKGGNPV